MRTPTERHDEAVDLDSVADEVYALPLEEFVAARTAQEKIARSAGDRELAAAIHGLAKPSAAAWLVNQLVRRHRDELTPLLELGANLREAMAALSGPQLRALGSQQHQLISALVGRARALAQEAGRAVSADTARAVEETLHAALADESAAEAVLAGRLTETLQRSGFLSAGDGLDGFGSDVDDGAARSGSARSGSARSGTARSGPARSGAARSGPARSGTARAGAAGPQDGIAQRRAAKADRERDEARVALERAEAALGRAQTARDEAQASADQTGSALDQADQVIERIRAELDAAVTERGSLAREHRRSLTTLEKAERIVRAAGRRRDDARP